MNRTELAESVAAKTGLDRRQSEAAVSAVTESIVGEIKSGNRVSIFGFGSFEPRARAARTARNPQTQATVKVPASKSVAFKPAAAFKQTLNSRKAAAKKATAAKKTTAKAATKATAAKATAKKAVAKKAPAKKAVAAKKATPAKATKAAKKR